MKIVTGHGKTTELIKESAKTGFYIVTRNRQTAEATFKEAHRLNLRIPFPITFENFIRKEYYGTDIKGFLIDDADLLLTRMTNVPITTMTVSEVKKIGE